MKAAKKVFAGSALVGSLLMAPLDTPLHQPLKEPKINLYNKLREVLLKYAQHKSVINLEYFLLSCGLLETPNITNTEDISVELKNGIKIKNPIGLAAGYDKEGKALENLFDLGFGVVEVGSVTPTFEHDLQNSIKISSDKAEIMSTGYGNNEGTQKTKSNLTAFYRDYNEKKIQNKELVGINILPNLETQEYTPFLTLNEFEYGAKEMLEYADYLVLNLSNAHTEGLKQFQKLDKLKELIQQIQKIRTIETGYLAALEYETSIFQEKGYPFLEEVENRSAYYIYNHYEKSIPIFPRKTPLLFIKIDSNLPNEKLIEIAKIANETKLDGIIVGSYVEASKDIEESQYEVTRNYKSGITLQEDANRALALLYKNTGGNTILVSNGGVLDAAEAVKRIKNGASFVQIYTGFIANGPYYVKDLKQNFEQIIKSEIEKNKVKGIQDLIGINIKQK